MPGANLFAPRTKYIMDYLRNTFYICLEMFSDYLKILFLLKAPASRDPKAAFCQPGHDFRVADDDCDERNLKKGFAQKIKGV